MALMNYFLFWLLMYVVRYTMYMYHSFLDESSAAACAAVCRYSPKSMLAIRTHEKNKGSPKATPAQKYFSVSLGTLMFQKCFM